jgi:hypothetical protein
MWWGRLASHEREKKARVEGRVVEGCRYDGLRASDPGTRLEAVGVTIQGCEMNGIYPCHNATVTVRGCAFHSNGEEDWASGATGILIHDDLPDSDDDDSAAGNDPTILLSNDSLSIRTKRIYLSDDDY